MSTVDLSEEEELLKMCIPNEINGKKSSIRKKITTAFYLVSSIQYEVSDNACGQIAIQNKEKLLHIHKVVTQFQLHEK